jgi:hypothetical protein
MCSNRHSLVVTSKKLFLTLADSQYLRNSWFGSVGLEEDMIILPLTLIVAGANTDLMITLKNTRAVTYRRYGIPALILEGKWLTEKYRLSIGDVVDIDYQQDEIRLRKNKTLSLDRKKKLKEASEINSKVYDHQTGNQEIAQRESA